MRSLPSLLFILVLLFVAVPVHGNVSPAEYDALTDFYNSLSGPKWKNQSNWLTGDPCSDEWFGVSCAGSSNAHVTSLTLSKNSLDGSLPSTIANLFDLDSLDLTVNTISSSIPSEINGLRALTLIDLSHNSLSGSIPSSMGDLVDFSLVSVDFSYNDLGGYVPQFFATDKSRFDYVDLSNNNFLCPIPTGAAYTQATCLQVNLSFTSQTCFNDPLTVNNALVVGSGFDTVSDLSLVCLFVMGPQTVPTAAYIASPTELFCAQPFINFTGCNGKWQEQEQMMAYGNFSIGMKQSTGEYSSISNSLPTNFLNNRCPYGETTTEYAEANTRPIHGCPHISFPKMSDAILACSHGNTNPYRCPAEVTYADDDGDFAKAVFDVNCRSNLTTTCMWAPLVASDPDSDGNEDFPDIYCPYFDETIVQCSIPYTPSGNGGQGTFSTSFCVNTDLVPDCSYRNSDEKEPKPQVSSSFAKEMKKEIKTLMHSVTHSVTHTIGDSVKSLKHFPSKMVRKTKRSMKIKEE